MNSKVTRPAHLDFDLDDIGTTIDAGVCPDDIAQELTGVLNASLPTAVSLEVVSIQGHEAYIHMRDGITGAETTGEVWLDGLDEIRGDAHLLIQLEEIAATAEFASPSESEKPRDLRLPYSLAW